MNSFLFFNANPLNKRVGDCVIRAFSFFFGVSWKKAFMDLICWCTERGLVNFNYRSVFNEYLKEQGFLRHKAPRKGMTVAEFRDEFAEEEETYLVSVKRHMTIVFRKDIVDTWDCSNKIVDGYWQRNS